MCVCEVKEGSKNISVVLWNFLHKYMSITMSKSLTLLRLTFRTGDSFFATSISSETASAIVAIELREEAAFDDHERKVSIVYL